jgi:hypothetical protein
MSQIRQMILDAIEGYWEQYHYGPAMEDIGVMTGRVKSNVLYHLRQMRCDGLVLFEDGIPRSLRTSKTDYLIKRSFYPGITQED